MRDIFLKLNYEIKAFIEREEKGSVHEKALSAYFHLAAIGVDSTENEFGKLLTDNEIIDLYVQNGLSRELANSFEKNIYSQTLSFIKLWPNEEIILNEMHGNNDWQNKENADYKILINFLGERAKGDSRYIPGRAVRKIRKEIINRIAAPQATFKRKEELNKIVGAHKTKIQAETHKAFINGYEYIKYVLTNEFTNYVNNN